MSYEEICKEQTELLNECRQNIKELTEENEKLKEQIDTSQVSRLIAEKEQLKQENEKLERTVKNKEDEIDWCDSKIEKLARENVYYEKENKALRLQANTYFDEWQTVKNLYTTLTNHIRMKAENNPGVSRYIDLVNYIDRLERVNDEKI
ncbi:hypothetical protein JGY90_10235 [Staphylococcus xylosus]|uniref:hypothetical protein n=1 Tax=Staphylococcus xylosus TaxID=1288 RepID=UPI001CDD89BB|nr:hypothetical protein [Staphylococcus xylosus]UBV34081.1 hypothetical protein JGY90_10235 [Staphylococcus xylosus]